jgi:hypothetical protein|tara:strand:- start:607 stop:858 length:252 start_codon:yes stop_codon:yes gene_type:complete
MKLYLPWKTHVKMTQTISPEDPQYFTETSDGLYDRHNYKIIGKNGESIVVDNWQTVQEIWWNRGLFLSHIEVLDQKNNGKGFK